jgi:hypothetical protein
LVLSGDGGGLMVMVYYVSDGCSNDDILMVMVEVMAVLMICWIPFFLLGDG